MSQDRALRAARNDPQRELLERRRAGLPTQYPLAFACECDTVVDRVRGGRFEHHAQVDLGAGVALSSSLETFVLGAPTTCRSCFRLSLGARRRYRRHDDAAVRLHVDPVAGRVYALRLARTRPSRPFDLGGATRVLRSMAHSMAREIERELDRRGFASRVTSHDTASRDAMTVRYAILLRLPDGEVHAWETTLTARKIYTLSRAALVHRFGYELGGAEAWLIDRVEQSLPLEARMGSTRPTGPASPAQFKNTSPLYAST